MYFDKVKIDEEENIMFPARLLINVTFPLK